MKDHESRKNQLLSIKKAKKKEKKISGSKIISVDKTFKLGDKNGRKETKI